MLSDADKKIVDFILNPEILQPGAEVVENNNEEVSKDGSPDNVDIISLFESGQRQEALDKICTLINENPQYASLYNDRAQMFILLKKYGEALADLDKAVSLMETVSVPATLKGSVYCQRGIVKSMIYSSENTTDVPPEALEDFQLAANSGNSFAKKELARMNPYAKLCNAMVKEMLSKYKK